MACINGMHVSCMICLIKISHHCNAILPGFLWPPRSWPTACLTHNTHTPTQICEILYLSCPISLQKALGSYVACPTNVQTLPDITLNSDIVLAGCESTLNHLLYTGQFACSTPRSKGQLCSMGQGSRPCFNGQVQFSRPLASLLIKSKATHF